jgi:hypothetical protein
LYEAIIEYKNKLREAEDNNTTKPQVTRYIGESILKICSNLKKKGNFAGYTWDLEGDAILDCVAAVDNFKPEKTNNPFAYFTMIAWNAFIRRISKEKKQTYVKNKFYENTMMNDMLNSGDTRIPRNEYSEDIIRSFEEKLEKNKNKAAEKVVDTTTKV